jgi:hypothetical protein
MASDDQAKHETFWQKFWLVVLDKGLLAGVIVFLTFLATVNADHLKTVWSTLWSYQEKLFDRRWEAYSELLRHADSVVAQTALYYQAPDDPSDPLAFDPWPTKIAGLKDRWDVISGNSSGSSGGSINHMGHVASALSGLVEARSKYALLIPNWLDDSLNDFIRIVQSDADAELTRIEKVRAAQDKKEADGLELARAEERERWAKIWRAYNTFKDNLRSTFGLDLKPTS